MFDSLPNRESRPLALLRRATLVFVGAFLIIGIVSAYRAWVQVRQLDLKASEQTLRNGSTVETAVLSSGRATVTFALNLFRGPALKRWVFCTSAATNLAFLIRVLNKLLKKSRSAATS